MNNLIIALIVLSGVFIYPTIGIINTQVYSQRFTVAQLSLFFLTAILSISVAVKKYNRWIFYLLVLCGVGLFKTMLLQQAPDKYIYESALFGAGIFSIYYAVRKLELE